MRTLLHSPSYLPFFFHFLCLIPLTLSTQSNGPHNFIIHIAKSDKPTLFSSHYHWYSSILDSLPPSSHPTKLLYTYNKAINGFSASLTVSQASKLQDIPGVLSVIPDQARQLHTTRTPHFLGLADNFGLWPNSNYAEDIIIGVLDTGIWPERRSFSDEGLGSVPSGWKGKCEIADDFPASACNKKIIGARAFHKGYEAFLKRPMNTSVESKSPRDTEGHGTHTASTAAGSVVKNASFYQYAQGEAKGMATKARIAAYKICWSDRCFDSDILAAMDQAIADGVHIISLSVGTSGYPPPYETDSIAIGSFGAAQHGVLVSASAGNSGSGPYTVTNIAPWILTVGASTIDREFPADAVLGNGKVFGGVSLYSGDPLGDFKLPLVYAANAGNKYCYVDSLDSSKVAGKIVVCDGGDTGGVEKGFAVKLAGGIGTILANTEDSGEELFADAHLIPTTNVGQIAGDQIKAYIKSDQNPTATIIFKGTVIGTSPPAPKVVAFSSRGPNYLTPEILKPDVIAPGLNILAAWSGSSSPTEVDIDHRRVEFNIISGTSMSCPHVSGLAALLKKAHPNWSPAAIKSALMTTAYNLDNSGKNIVDLSTGKESTPFVHGAGHVDPNRALDPGLVYDIDINDYVAFLCSIGYDSKTISIFLKKTAGTDICDKNLSSPGDLNYPTFSVVFESNNKESVKYKRYVKNIGSNVDAVYEVKVDSPAGVEIKVVPSKLKFHAEKQTQMFEVTISKGIGYSGSAKFGSIEWTDGIHHVRSPIAVRWTSGAAISI